MSPTNAKNSFGAHFRPLFGSKNRIFFASAKAYVKQMLYICNSISN